MFVTASDFAPALDTARLCAFRWDTVSGQVQCVGGLVDVLGLTSGITIWEEVRGLVDAPTAEALDAALAAVREHGAAADIVFPLQTRAGEALWVTLRAKRLQDTPTVLTGMLLDVTRFVTAQNEARQKGDLLQRVLDALPLGVWVADAAGQLVLTNPAGARIWGEARLVHEDRYGEFRAWRRNSGERIEAHEWALARALRAGETSRDEVLDIEAFDGTRKTILNSAVPIREPDGHISGAIALNEEVTEEVRAQDALHESEERFRLVAQAISDIVWEWRLEGDQLRWHGPTTKVFGYRAEDVGPEGRWWIDRLHPDERAEVMRNLQRAHDSQAATWQASYRFRHADGHYVAVEDRATLIRDAHGTVVRAVGAMTDVTEARRLQAELVDAQKMETVGRLAGGVAHEFNNLLAIIQGHAELIGLDTSCGESARGAAEAIRAASIRAAMVTRQLLTFSRRHAGEPRALDANELLRSMLAMLRPAVGPRIRVELGLDPDLGLVRADREQFEQVIVNVVLNARDAMPDGGTLEIRTRNVTLGPVTAGRLTTLPGEYVHLSIADSGTGMSEDVRQRVFEPFFTTKPPGAGTGLGLATSYSIVGQHDGYMWVESTPGQGTVVNVCLPALQGAVRQSSSRATGGAVNGTRAATVLVVDDEELVRQWVTTLLRRAGYHVLQAADAEEALSLALGRLDEIDVLLTDVVMPGPPAQDVAERLVAARPELRVVFMTGYRGDATLQCPGIARAVPVLQKPFRSSELLNLLSRALVD